MHYFVSSSIRLPLLHFVRLAEDIPILVVIGISCILYVLHSSSFYSFTCFLFICFDFRLVAVFVQIVRVSRAARNITTRSNPNSAITFQAQKRIMTLVVVVSFITSHYLRFSSFIFILFICFDFRYLIILFVLVFEWRIALNNAVVRHLVSSKYIFSLLFINLLIY